MPMSIAAAEATVNAAVKEATAVAATVVIFPRSAVKPLLSIPVSNNSLPSDAKFLTFLLYNKNY